MMIAIKIKKKQNMIIMIRDYSLMANVLPKKNYKVMETETYMDMWWHCVLRKCMFFIF